MSTRNRAGLALAFAPAGVTLIGGPIAIAQASMPTIPAFLTGTTPTTPAPESPTPSESTPTTEPSPTTFLLTGQIKVSPSDYNTDEADGEVCAADVGYSDIDENVQVEVQDGAGATLAFGTLEAGEMSDGMCEFDFVVYEVPEGEEIYAIQIGRETRGSLKYTRDELRSAGDSVALSLGS